MADGAGSSGDAFDVLGLPARYDLSRAQVQAAYLARVAIAHPDRAGDADAFIPGALNAAKRTLEDAEERGNALLARLGGPSKEKDRSLPDGFLHEMMDVRERADAARESADASTLGRLVTWAEERRSVHERRVGELFASVDARAGDGVRADAAGLAAIRRELNAWRYIERMIEQLDGGVAL